MIASKRMLPLCLAVACLGLTACATTTDPEQQALSQALQKVESSHGDRLGKLENAVQQLSQSYQALNQKVDANHDAFIKTRLEGKLLKQIVLTEDQIMYPPNSADLTGRDVQSLDSLAQELKNSETAYHVEIQGHTDDSGNPEFNYILGEGRAKAVQNYLHERGGIPFYRMSTVSYGARIPATEATGLTGNRRVQVLIYR